MAHRERWVKQRGNLYHFCSLWYDLAGIQTRTKMIHVHKTIVPVPCLLLSRRSRVGGVKVRHKRQVLQDMARPLKHWLYKHRDNPYPTKTEKVLLALGSHMTLVQVRDNAHWGFIWDSKAASRLFNKILSAQVSNWFANARRRLKNTVRQPDLSWALRIKLYNNYIQGNAERLSVCSDDTDTDGMSSQPGLCCNL